MSYVSLFSCLLGPQVSSSVQTGGIVAGVMIVIIVLVIVALVIVIVAVVMYVQAQYFSS